MENISILPGAKAIIQLDQNGNELKVFVAREGAGEPLQDLTGKGQGKPNHETDSIPSFEKGKTRRARIEFHEGNCVWCNGKWYCV
jgi:hypothetical protein